MEEDEEGEVKVDSGQEDDDDVGCLSLVHFLNPSVGDLEELVVLKTLDMRVFAQGLVAVRTSEVRLGYQWRGRRGRRESSSFSFLYECTRTNHPPPAALNVDATTVQTPPLFNLQEFLLSLG